jgi:kynurenine formamidase
MAIAAMSNMIFQSRFLSYACMLKIFEVRFTNYYRKRKYAQFNYLKSHYLCLMIQAKVNFDGQLYEANLKQAIDISIPMFGGEQNPNAFHIPFPRFEPIQVGSFVGSVAQGSSANCENLFFNPHGNGTHTECIGHITLERISIHESLRSFFFLAQLISVQPETTKNNDQIITSAVVKNGILDGIEALIVRTTPNHNDKLTKKYSGSNPCYLSPEFAKQLVDKGIAHLLVDLPSVDREEDEGKMLAHKAFWSYPENPRLHATITEMVFVPDEVEDGLYLLNIQVASLQTDASPSKPLLFRLNQVN